MNAECRMENSELCIMHSEFERSELRDGGLAQLGERLPCKQEVSGSIPLISTNLTKEVAIGKIEFRGSERPLLTTCRWHVVTAVAFPQKSDPANLHHILKEID